MLFFLVLISIVYAPELSGYFTFHVRFLFVTLALITGLHSIMPTLQQNYLRYVVTSLSAICSTYFTNLTSSNLTPQGYFSEALPLSMIATIQLFQCLQTLYRLHVCLIPKHFSAQNDAAFQYFHRSRVKQHLFWSFKLLLRDYRIQTLRTGVIVSLHALFWLCHISKPANHVHILTPLLVANVSLAILFVSSLQLPSLKRFISPGNDALLDLYYKSFVLPFDSPPRLIDLAPQKTDIEIIEDEPHNGNNLTKINISSPKWTSYQNEGYTRQEQDDSDSGLLAPQNSFTEFALKTSHPDSRGGLAELQSYEQNDRQGTSQNPSPSLPFPDIDQSRSVKHKIHIDGVTYVGSRTLYPTSEYRATKNILPDHILNHIAPIPLDEKEHGNPSFSRHVNKTLSTNTAYSPPFSRQPSSESIV